ncbi:3-ketosteroid 9alpha-monooxygenase subunit B [Pseudomonas panipatensis]|uniref:3-ketosteroid 9alpha-monooxygenase subunit B n=2 Tax=Pseudomonas panipatensis TaxID=428992 RepID=A0A1G8EN61_9PSED|nr:3-ketosteroid 9alpha-monooxygenase subunit B [Pseudomonas panipatensis]SMP68439.1 3-ketosteroid 9alpha-monooxygenase subunit B [Pseudomonas panipatensis]
MMGSAQTMSPTAATTASGSFSLEVAEVIDETADARSLVLRIPEALAERFRYQAGQFLTFRVPFAGQRLTRCYSMSSAPELDAQLRVTVKRVDGGRVSNWMNENVRAGDHLDVLPPAGHFHLGAQDRELVLFGGGSGITPVYSILRSALATRNCRVRLIYANRDEASVIFRDELRELARAHGERLQVIHVLDSVQGFLGAADVRHLVHDRHDAEFFICGPGPFMDTVERTLLELQVEPARIHVERFVSPPDPDALDAAQEQARSAAAEVAVERLRVALDGAEYEVPCTPGETLLESCRKAGLAAPASCEEGFCGACMCRVEQGEVLLPRNDVLSPAELAEGWTLACQGRPGSREVSVRFPD